MGTLRVRFFTTNRSVTIHIPAFFLLPSTHSLSLRFFQPPLLANGHVTGRCSWREVGLTRSPGSLAHTRTVARFLLPLPRGDPGGGLSGRQQRCSLKHTPDPALGGHFTCTPFHTPGCCSWMMLRAGRTAHRMLRCHYCSRFGTSNHSPSRRGGGMESNMLSPLPGWLRGVHLHRAHGQDRRNVERLGPQHMHRRLVPFPPLLLSDSPQPFLLGP